MTKANGEQLKKAVDEVHQSTTPRTRLNALTEAFHLYSQETASLKKDYLNLKNEFISVTEKLEDANKQLSQKVAELEIVATYMNCLLQNMNQGLIFIGLNDLVTTYNPQSEKILGIKAVDVLFRPYQEVFTDKLFGFSLAESFKTHEAPKFTHITLTPCDVRSEALELDVEATFISQKSEWKDLGTTPLSDFTQGLLLMVRDVTEIERLERISIQNDRMKELGEMVSLISHEIRNPLGGIRGFAALLEQSLPEESEEKTMSRKIIQGIDSLTYILNDIVNYSRPFEIHRVSTNINALIEETVNEAKMDEAFSHKTTISLELPKEPLFIPIEGSLIKSCLLNLFYNAAQAMPEGGNIDVCLTYDPTYGYISVTDTGVGISEQNLQKIFRPFFTTKPKGRGTGIGLAEVSRITQAHHGKIDVVSQLGKGSRFTLALPLHP
ncbi:MAG: hypothetical protein Tsb0021_14970 [Chlamydiales bacterium]